MPVSYSEPPLIFNYLDYREYLDGYFSFRKDRDKTFSLRTFARHPELRLSSSSFISAILTGRKNLSQNLRIRFGRAMRLKAGEMEYFELLIQFNQSKSSQERSHYFVQLSRFHGSKARVLHEAQYRFYARWHYGVVWNYFGMHHDRNNPSLIGKSLMPALSAAQVEEAIRLLLELKLIKKMANGYAVTDRHLATGKGFRGPMARQHSRELLQTALESVDRVPARERRFNAMSFSISPQGLERIRERMDVFRAEMREIVETDSGENRIYALALQLFPCSMTGSGEAKDSKEGKRAKAGTTSESGNPES